MRDLDENRADQLGEAVPGAVQAAFHSTKVAAGDFRDFLVALTLQLTQDEHLTMMLGQPLHALVDRVFQEPLAVEIVGAISWAKLFRARFRRLFTVPRLQPVISAISWKSP